MTTTEPGLVLIETNLWATRLVLDACEALTDEQFHRRFEMGLGSLHDTLRHTIGAIRGWTDVLAQRESRPRPEQGATLSIDQLRAMLDESHEEFRDWATRGSHADVLNVERDGKPYAFTRGGILVHVTTHAMHHRAQCLNMLRQLGVEDLPNPSVMWWMLTDGAPDG